MMDINEGDESKDYVIGITYKNYAVMTIVSQACHSGAMMPHLAGNNRILISAANSTEDSWSEAGRGESAYEHFAFLHEGKARLGTSYPGFTPSLGNMNSPCSIYYGFQMGKTAAQKNYGLASTPQLNITGIFAETIYL